MSSASGHWSHFYHCTQCDSCTSPCQDDFFYSHSALFAAKHKTFEFESQRHDIEASCFHFENWRSVDLELECFPTFIHAYCNIWESGPHLFLRKRWGPMEPILGHILLSATLKVPKHLMHVCPPLFCY